MKLNAPRVILAFGITVRSSRDFAPSLASNNACIKGARDNQSWIIIAQLHRTRNYAAQSVAVRTIERVDQKKALSGLVSGKSSTESPGWRSRDVATPSRWEY